MQAMARNVRKKIQREMAKEEDGATTTAPSLVLQPPPTAQQHQSSVLPLLLPPPTAQHHETYESSAPPPPLLEPPAPHEPPPTAPQHQGGTQPGCWLLPPPKGGLFSDDSYTEARRSAQSPLLLNSKSFTFPATDKPKRPALRPAVIAALAEPTSQPLAEPTSRQLAASVGSAHPNIYVQHDAFQAKNPRRLAKQQAWCKDVARQAERCGYNEDHSYCDIHRLGEWWECDELDRKVYLPEDRKIQFERLDEHAQPPSDEELDGLKFPQRLWWSDRDRIVLLHEFLLAEPPDGSYRWEEDVLAHSWHLWADYLTDGKSYSDELDLQSESDDEGEMPEIDLGHCKVVSSKGGLLAWPSGFKYLPAPGWRLLSSMTSCPNPYLRYPTLASSIPIDEYNLLL